MEEATHVNLEEVLQGCRNHDRSSQQQLFTQYYNYAMTIARRYMGGNDAAEEVVNDAFYKVFTKIHMYSSRQPFRPWLRRIVVNTAIDQIRSANKWVKNDTTPPPEGISLPDVVENITQEQIWAMLDALPPAYRTVFNLAVVDGFTHEEIAETLGISIGASKSNLSRARQYLKNLLQNEFEFFG